MKKSMKKKALALLFGVVSLGLVLPMTAGATCTITGKVFRTYNISGQTTAFIKPSTIPSYSSSFYTVTSTDLNLRADLRACSSTGVPCQVIGSASSCPAISSGGPSIGIATVVTINP